MITYDNKTTSVEFGKSGIGSVGLLGGRGRLIVQQLIHPIDIGSPFDKDKDVSELPKVVFNFNEVSSVDALIKVLEKVKEKMNEPDPNAYAYAC